MLTIKAGPHWYGIRRWRREPASLERFEQSYAPGTHAIVGVNGAGKSTLLRLVAGVMAGTATVTAPWQTKDRERYRHIGYLPQEVRLPGHMTAQQFVAYAAWLKGMRSGVCAGAAREALARTDTIDLAMTHCRALSGGMQRRVQLAAAIVHSPELMLLDEPTSSLDPVQRVVFHDLVNEKLAGSTVLMATHLMEDVAAVAGTVTVLSAGATAWRGDTADLCDDPVELGRALRERLSSA